MLCGCHSHDRRPAARGCSGQLKRSGWQGACRCRGPVGGKISAQHGQRSVRPASSLDCNICPFPGVQKHLVGKVKGRMPTAAIRVPASAHMTRACTCAHDACMYVRACVRTCGPSNNLWNSPRSAYYPPACAHAHEPPSSLLPCTIHRPQTDEHVHRTATLAPGHLSLPSCSPPCSAHTRGQPRGPCRSLRPCSLPLHQGLAAGTLPAALVLLKPPPGTHGDDHT
jgi:hypothetical protein